MKLFHMPVLMDRFGVSRATIHRYIKRQLITKPVKIGYSSVWPSYECDAIIKARIAGKSEDQIKALVEQLENDRKDLSDFNQEGV